MSGQVLWHGGAPGRDVGDLLLPPSVTGIPSLLHQQSLRDGMASIGQRSDRVYLTIARDWAWAFASMWRPTEQSPMGGGSLYRVTAEDVELEDDFQSLNGVALQTSQASVVEVAIRTVGFNRRRCLQIIEHHLAQHESAKGTPR